MQGTQATTTEELDNVNAAQRHTAQGHSIGGNTACRATVDIVRDILHGVRLFNGATVTVLESRTVPTSGYVVALPGHELRISPDESDTVRTVREYVERKRGVVAGARITRPTFYGAWLDGDTIYLDVVEILQDRNAAVAAGKARGELAIWDLERGEEIRTDS